jgi:hypothetical protein
MIRRDRRAGSPRKNTVPVASTGNQREWAREMRQNKVNHERTDRLMQQLLSMKGPAR